MKVHLLRSDTGSRRDSESLQLFFHWRILALYINLTIAEWKKLINRRVGSFLPQDLICSAKSMLNRFGFLRVYGEKGPIDKKKYELLKSCRVEKTPLCYSKIKTFVGGPSWLPASSVCGSWIANFSITNSSLMAKCPLAKGHRFSNSALRAPFSKRLSKIMHCKKSITNHGDLLTWKWCIAFDNTKSYVWKRQLSHAVEQGMKSDLVRDLKCEVGTAHLNHVESVSFE